MTECPNVISMLRGHHRQVPDLRSRVSAGCPLHVKANRQTDRVRESVRLRTNNARRKSCVDGRTLRQVTFAPNSALAFGAKPGVARGALPWNAMSGSVAPRGGVPDGLYVNVPMESVIADLRAASMVGCLSAPWLSRTILM